MFYFILHPLQWLNEQDAGRVHTCQEKSNRYIVSWVENGGIAVTTYSREEVMEAMTNGYWILTDKQGNH